MPISKSIVAIVGTTGAAKSRLAVDIARTFKGEVINADAMQVYRGLEIITNKITHDEMCGVPHHLLGCRMPGEEYVVGHWVSDAVQLVSRPTSHVTRGSYILSDRRYACTECPPSDSWRNGILDSASPLPQSPSPRPERANKHGKR